MPIRIDCPLEGFQDLWVEFRDSNWSFGDRRRVTDGMSDSIALDTILKYVVRWNLKDLSGNEVPLEKRTIEELDAVDDAVVTWLIRAWFAARNQRASAPKNS